MPAPLVHVIVLNYNGRDMTLQCIESLHRQTYSNIQIVLVNNGSNDGCVEAVAERWPGVKILALTQNLGYAGGANAGMRHALDAGCDYLITLNNDMLLDPRFLAELLAVAETNPAYGLVAPRIYMHHPPSQRAQSEGGYYSLWTGFADSYYRNQEVGPNDRLESHPVSFAVGCCFARADALRKIGLLDETLFAYCEDVDWSARMIAAGYQIATAPRAAIWHLEIRATSNPWRFRISTRNMIVVHARYARWYHYLTAAPYFFCRWMLYMTAREVLHRRWREAAALWQGAADALRGRPAPRPH